MKTGNSVFRIRKFTGDVLLVLVILLTASVVFVMPARIGAIVQKADARQIFTYQIVLCAVLLLFALDVRFSLFTRWQSVLLKGIGWVLRTVVILLSAVILYFCGKVTVGGLIHTADRADHAIVLGLALENGKPAPDLLARLATARGYLEKYPEARLILTGGNADETGHSEAAVMHDLLIRQGVPESRLMMEDQAANTRENFRGIAAMISKDAPIVMISSNYHMDRAVRTAGEEGFTHLMRLPAPSGFFAFGANMLSEVVLDLNDLTK